MAARALFVLYPAVIAALIGALIHPAIGMIFGVCVAGLGIQVTRSHP